MVPRLTIVSLALLTAATGCGDGWDMPTRASSSLPDTVPIGRGPAHRPPALSAAVRRGRPVAGMPCQNGGAARYGVHVELFGDAQSAVIPAGIGIAPPWRGRPPYVDSGRCSYALRTREPTGVVEVSAGPTVPTLGRLFALWGQPLARTRAGAFRGRVKVWLDGQRWHGDPGAVPLRRHAQVVLAVGARVPVHARYLFPPGL